MATTKMRLLSLPAALLLLPMLLPAYPAGAAELSDYTYTVQADGTISITGYRGKDTALEIPASINGAAVTAIGDHAFEYDQSITSIDLPNSLVSIGAYAFNDCSGLLEIEFPNGLVTVGEGAFFSCTRLTEVTLPESLTDLDTDAFYGCTGLTSVTVPGSVKNFGDHVFENCTALTTATLGEGLTALPAQTFYDCPLLSQVTLPTTLRTIGDRAFVHADSLKSIQLPAGLKRIGDHAFQASALKAVDTAAAEIGTEAFSGCQTLSSLTLREGVQTVGENAFSGAPLQQVNLPASLTTLGTGAFSRTFTTDSPTGETLDSGLEKYTVASGNTAFTATDDGVLYSKDGKTLLAVPVRWSSDDGIFTVPDNVTAISDSAFAQCSKIKKIVLPDGLTTLGEGAFINCKALEEITLPDGIQALPADTFANCVKLTTVNLPASLHTISDHAFLNCTALTKLTLPDTVTSLTGAAFDGCNQTIALTLADSNPTYQFTDGALYTKDGTTLVAYLGGKDSFTVPDTVTTLADYAIVAPQVKSITLPESIAKLGSHAVGFSCADGTATTSLTNDFVLYSSANAAIQYAGQNGITCFTGVPAANAQTAALQAGQTFAYQIKNAPAQLVEYGSSNTSVAKVDAKGTVTAIANGTADIFAVVGQQSFTLSVTVTGGKDAVDPYADYRVFNSEADINSWYNDYAAYNNGISLQAADNASIANYSTNNFAYIFACQPGGTAYIPEAEAAFGKNGYSQFKTVAANLHTELARYKLNENVVGFSGTSDVSDITGAGNTMADMTASIGRKFKTQIAISTSLDHSVSANFSGTGRHYMLEIYAPKDGTNGAYIDKISRFSGEQELLLNDGITLEVVDAGIRRYTKDSAPEWYIKLRIVPDEPAPSSTPTATVSPTPTPTATPTPTNTPAQTAAPTATPVPTATPNDREFYSCPKCGYHNWTATADGYRCDHCGNVVTLQLNGYPNVKGYTDVAKLTQTPAATQKPAPVKDPTAGTLPAATQAPTAEPTPTVTTAPTATPAPSLTPAPTEVPQSAAKAALPQWLKILLGVLILGSAAMLFVVLVILPRKKNSNYHHR